MGIIPIGLDGEMTGSEIADGHRLIQIGVATAVDVGPFDVSDGPGCQVDVFTADIGQPTAPIDPRASEVHGFSDQRIRNGPPADEVDGRLRIWLEQRGGRVKGRRLAPVGFNVARFDMPFVEQALPQTNAVLSRRTIDLNASLYTLQSLVELGGGHPTRSGLKRMAKRWAAEELTRQGHQEAWHDAGYDAAAALLAFRWLRASIVGTAPISQ